MEPESGDGDHDRTDLFRRPRCHTENKGQADGRLNDGCDGPPKEYGLLLDLAHLMCFPMVTVASCPCSATAAELLV